MTIISGKITEFPLQIIYFKLSEHKKLHGF